MNTIGGYGILTGMKERPRVFSRRRFIKASVVVLGAGLADAACGGGSKNSLPSSPTPGETRNSTISNTQVLETQAPATPEAPTPAPTEAPAEIPGEHGYSSVEKMPDVPKEVQEKIEEILGKSDKDVITKRSIIAREEGYDERTTCPERLDKPNTSKGCTSIDDIKLNTADYPDSADRLDALGLEGLKILAERDGGTPLIKAYDGDTVVIKDIPLTQDPSKVIFVYEFINGIQKAGAPERTIIAPTSGRGYTDIVHTVGEWAIINQRIYVEDALGYNISETDITERFVTAGAITTGTASRAYPGLKAAPLKHGETEFQVSQAAAETVGRGFHLRLYPITEPNRSEVNDGKNGIINSILRANGEYHIGKPIPRTNYK